MKVKELIEKLQIVNDKELEVEVVNSKFSFGTPQKVFYPADEPKVFIVIT